MSWLFASGHVVDLLLAIIAVEAAWLIAHRRRSGHGVPTDELAATLMAGVFLMMALRSALTGAAWEFTAMFLALSGVAHLVELWRRWR